MMTLEEKWKRTSEVVGSDQLSIIMLYGRLSGDIDANMSDIADVLENHGVNAELVMVDDGNAVDVHFDRLESLFAKYSHISLKVVRCRHAGAIGLALKQGFEASKGGYVLLWDGDAGMNLRRIPLFFEEMVVKNADIVIGSKRHPDSTVEYPLRRRLVSGLYFILVRLFLGLSISDTQSGMKLFRRQTLGYALDRMLVKQHAFDLELLTIAFGHGAKIAEAPITVSSTTTFNVVSPKTCYRMINDSLAVFYRARILNYYEQAMVSKQLDREPLISIVIACPSSSWMLDECLAAITAQTYSNWECIVLPDGDEQPAAGTDARIRFLPTGKVRPAEKRNLGIAEAKGEIVAFIDDDAYPDAHWLAYAVRYFGERDIGAVGGPGVTPPGDRRLARIGGRVYDSVLVSGNYNYRYRAGGVRKDVDDYPSCNLFVRRDLLLKIKGYRTDFWPGEDTLLCKDIIDNWQRIVYDPWVVVYHHRRPLFVPHLRQLGRYAFHRGYFCKRFPSNSLRLSYFVPSAFVLYLLLLLPTPLWAAQVPALAWLWVSPLLLYTAMTLISSFSIRPHYWLLTALGIFCSHIWYGIRFIRGLCAQKAPCEYIGVDHATATVDVSKKGMTSET